MIDQFHIWASFLVIFLAMAAYATERISIEITSLLFIVVLLLLFSLVPLLDADGVRLIGSSDILAGFGNPALITIMALLVMAQGLFQSGALEKIIEQASRKASRRADIAIIVVLLGAMISSAFLNNTPVVLMTIPILVAMAARANMKAGQQKPTEQAALTPAQRSQLEAARQSLRQARLLLADDET